ncbi:MAG: TolB protein [Algoriphagus sp.]|jgi:TolB protein
MKTITILVIFLSVSFSLIAQVPENITSELVILNIKTGAERTILREKRHFEAPNWSRDGNFLLINSGGFLERVDLEGKKLGQLFPDQLSRANNDHGISFDGKTLIISKSEPGQSSQVYTMPMDGSSPPKLLTSNHPSYWHGISPDGKTLAYCAQRNDAWDIYAIPSSGGAEVRLTDTEGLDDGPEYSYDGTWIYFNSNRTGRMQAYRMKTDGSGAEQLTNDELDNWFPHPSPDNKSAVIISYLEDQKGSHPFGKDVKLRLLNVETKDVKDLTPVFYGGQGTINVHSWSPDGDWIAFVRYLKH